MRGAAAWALGRMGAAVWSTGFCATGELDWRWGIIQALERALERERHGEVREELTTAIAEGGMS